MTDRHAKILEVLAAQQRVEVAALADILQVSQVTVRKDLDHLEEKGLIRREHGYALFGSVDEIGRRMAVDYEIKRRLAKAAAALVDDGETVMIESGSCCTLLAEELARSDKNVTIITNSVYIANHIRHYPQCKVILLGGEYQSSGQVLVGAITRKCAEVFFSDKLFIGADGYDMKYGFTGRDHLRSETIRDLAEQAAEVIVLTESKKFSQKGVQGTIRTERVSKVFTDDQIPPEKEEFLRRNNVEVYTVPSETKVYQIPQRASKKVADAVHRVEQN